MQATDRDEPPNSEIVYGIVNSNYSDKFTIDPTTGWLENNGPLDREAMQAKDNGQVKLNVTATDKGSPPLATWVPVIINVEVRSLSIPHKPLTSAQTGCIGTWAHIYKVSQSRTVDLESCPPWHLCY